MDWIARIGLPGFEVGILTLFLGPGIAGMLNVIWRIAGRTPARTTHRFIQARGDPFEMMLMEFLKSQELLMITLKSNKVYIGRVITSINPARNVDSIRLGLHTSGHRVPVSHLLKIDIRYEETHAEIRKAVIRKYEEAIANYLADNIHATMTELERNIFGSIDMAQLGVVNFESVILVREIQSLNPFEPDIYKKYFDAKYRDPEAHPTY